MTWTTRLGDVVAKAIGATAFLGLAAVVVAVVAPMTRSPQPIGQKAEDDDRPAPPAHKNDDDRAGAATKKADDPLTVTLDRDSQVKSGIATKAAAPASFQERVRAFAAVLPIDRVVALYNASLTSVAQLEAAKAKQTASHVADERAQTLYKTFTTAKAQAQTAAATAEIDTAGVATVAAQVEALRNTALQEWGPVLGEAIVARKPLAADLVGQRTRLVQVSVRTGMKAPQTVSFELADGTRATGRLVSEATQVDPRVQNVGYLYSIPTVAGLLPGSTLVASLPASGARAGFDVPPSSIVWQGGKPWLYVRVAPDQFQRRSIGDEAAPTAAGGYVLPSEALAGGATALVTTGAQVLLSQEMRAQIPTDGDD